MDYVIDLTDSHRSMFPVKVSIVPHHQEQSLIHRNSKDVMRRRHSSSLIFKSSIQPSPVSSTLKWDDFYTTQTLHIYSIQDLLLSTTRLEDCWNQDSQEIPPSPGIRNTGYQY